MKPLYAILLVFGAALAGGLAFELSQPKPFEIATATEPAPPITPRPVNPAPLRQTIPSETARPKPSPMPPTDTYTSAPPAVYQDKPEPPPARPTPRAVTPQMPPPAQRPASSKPVQWFTVPYQRPAGNSATSQAPAAKPAPQENKLEARLETRTSPQPTPQPVPETPPAPERPAPRHVTLPTGMAIAIRLSEPLSAERATAGDHFRGALLEPLVADGLVIAERGARVTGRVVETQKQNWTHKSMLELELSTVSTSDGQEVTVPSDPWTLMGGDQSASASTGTVIHFRLAGKVVVTERPL